MLQHRKHITLLAGLAVMVGILGCLPARRGYACCRSGQPPATPGGDLVTLTLAKPGDKSTLGEKDGALWLEIESPSGIGAGSATWTVTPTTPVMLRLHLGGLEELRLVNGDAATSSRSPAHPHICAPVHARERLHSCSRSQKAIRPGWTSPGPRRLFRHCAQRPTLDSARHNPGDPLDRLLPLSGADVDAGVCCFRCATAAATCSTSDPARRAGRRRPG